MPFKRTYEDSRLENRLYVTVLVRCTKCGGKDKIKSKGLTDGQFEIDYFTDSFINSENIADHGQCPICHAQEWEERKEVIEIGYPAPFNESVDKNYLTLQKLQENVGTLQTQLRVAEENGFRLHSIDSKSKTILLHK